MIDEKVGVVGEERMSEQIEKLMAVHSISIQLICIVTPINIDYIDYIDCVCVVVVCIVVWY